MKVVTGRVVQGKIIPETEGLPEKEALALELAIGQPIFATEDAKEGPRAFMEKRKANFKGR